MFELKTWRILDTGKGSASWNMGVDEALLTNFKEDDLPILRLYGWERALSLGRFSDIEQSLDQQKIDEMNFSYVRRMTGGGVLVHAEDISYSLILPRKLLKEVGVKESYHYLCRFLIQFYARLGLDASFASDLQLKQKRSDICLAGHEAYDIMIEDKKMGGNAQRYTHDALFQHGSIPISMDKSHLEVLFISESGLEGAATLEELGCEMSYEKLVLLLRDAFTESFGIDAVLDTLRSCEEEDAKKLMADKYTQQRWNVYAEQ